MANRWRFANSGLRGVLALSAVTLGACVQPVALDGRPCPCEAGYLCCLPTQRCVAQSSCVSADLNACAPELNTRGDMIANLETDGFAVRGGGVNGTWFTFRDDDHAPQKGLGTVSVLPERLATAVCGSDYALHAKSQNFSIWGSGLGFTLNTVSSSNQPFDARGHAGLRFWMKGTLSNETQAVHLDLYDQQRSNDCKAVVSGKCDNLFTRETPVRATWQEYRVRFSELDSQLVTNELVTIQWAMPLPQPSPSYDFWIDDVAWLDD